MQQSSASSAFSPRALELPLLDPQVARRESLDAGVLAVERVFSQGVEKDCKKSSRQRRRVPLRGRVVDAIKAMPPRIDTPILFPAPRGGRIDLEKFRYRQWVPTLRAADIPHRRIYGHPLRVCWLAHLRRKLSSLVATELSLGALGAVEDQLLVRAVVDPVGAPTLTVQEAPDPRALHAPDHVLIQN